MRTLEDEGYVAGDILPFKNYIVLDYPAWFDADQLYQYQHSFIVGDVVVPKKFGDKELGYVRGTRDGLAIAFLKDIDNNNLQWVPLCCLTTAGNENLDKLPKGI